ncbi:hypothetical protein CSW98_15305 [Vibrio sp. HA2012]|nr:hypothetical protein CSW98_15305 [Vibrio sp. HA2012]
MYLVVPHSGYPSWMLRFTSNKKRREMTLGKVSVIDGQILLKTNVSTDFQCVNSLIKLCKKRIFFK